MKIAPDRGGQGSWASCLWCRRHVSWLQRLLTKFPSAGFTGILCDENIDNCDPDPCHHGQCQDGIDSYTCICNPGYMGAICSDQIDECYSSPCLNDGRCIDLVNGYQCNCQPGTSGRTVPTRLPPSLCPSIQGLFSGIVSLK